MRIATATSESTDTPTAVEEAADSLRAALGGEGLDLCLVFATSHHREGFQAALRRLDAALPARHRIGCVSEAVLGGMSEHEGTPALVLWAARLPAAGIVSAHIGFRQTPDGYVFVGGPEIPDEAATLILLGDPASFPADLFARRVNGDHPKLQILGGLASGARSPGESMLCLGSEVHREGAVAVLLPSGVRVQPLVSQGCRPFGRPFVITRAEKNAIIALRGQPAIEILKEQIGLLPPEDRQMLAHGLHIGIAIDAAKETHARGDFLVRGILGFDSDRGAIVVGDSVRSGQTVQFHVRDAGTASEDLHVLLRDARPEAGTPVGALLFTCNGRGKRLFQSSDHDARAVTNELGGIPVAGFFAAGEIGPISGRNFLHGFTASVAMFVE